MAKENSVLLHGVALTDGKVKLDSFGTPVRAQLTIKVIDRKNASMADNADDIRFAKVMIYSGNDEIIEKMQKVVAGDMVDVYGMITTVLATKKCTCPTCGVKADFKSHTTYVTPLYICKREHTENDEEARKLLLERVEISNRVTVIGNICRQPGYYDNDGQYIPTLDYQLAIPRTIRVHDDTADLETDYPYVIARGDQAKEGLVHLRTGSMVYIKGHLRSQENQHKTQCDACKTFYIARDFDKLIITPHFTEYLKDCYFPEENNK